MTTYGEVVSVQVPKWWLDDVLAVLRDLGTHQPLINEAGQFSTVHATGTEAPDA